MRRTSVATKIILVLAFLAAIGVRLGFVHYVRGNQQAAGKGEAVATSRPTITDVPTSQSAGVATDAEARWTREGYYGAVARNLLAYRRFCVWSELSGREPWEGARDDQPPGTAFVPPGYPALLAGVFKAAPGARSYMALFAVQAVIGALGCVFVFYLARRVFRSTFVGWLAFVGTAISYFLVSAGLRINPAVLASTMVTASVLTTVAAGDTGSFWRHVLAGVVAGLTVLVIPAYLIVLPFAYLWSLAHGRAPGGKRFGLSLVCVLFFLATVAPWTIRNYRVFRTAAPVVDSLGFHAWVGNNDLATGGDLGASGLPVVVEAAREGRVPSTHLTFEVERFRDMGRWAWTWMTSSPRNVELRLKAYAYFWTGRTLWLSPGDPGKTYRNPVSVAVMALMFILALVGIGARKNDGQRALAWMIYLVLILFPLPYAVTHAGQDATFRLPLDPLLLILAAYAVATFLTGGRVALERVEPEAGDEDDLDDVPILVE